MAQFGLHGSDPRLAVKIFNQCSSNSKNNVNDGMTLCKLPLKESFSCNVGGSWTKIRRFSFGDSYSSKMSKTIMLMGATGSGKSTMINAIINYVLGVEWDDPFRFILVDEEINKSQAFSQTREVTAYDIHFKEGFKIPYSLTIVDTPGFGDTGGTERDNETTLAIKQFFDHQNGIQVLDAVGFTIRSSDVRLTASQVHIFNSVLEIFSKDIKENVHFLVTNYDGNEIKAFHGIKAAKLPYVADSNGSPPHQAFNNGALFVSSRTANRMLKFQWEDGMDSFKSFFDTLFRMPTKSLRLTKEVLKNREMLLNKIECLHENIKHQVMKMEELQTIEEEIKKFENLADKNSNFEFKVKVPKKVQTWVGDNSAMNCSTCEKTCHYPCNGSLLTSLCPIFWTTWLGIPTPRLHCDVCDCGMGSHGNESNKWEVIQVEETRTHSEVKKMFEDAMNKKLSAEKSKNTGQTEVEIARNKILKDVNIISECSKQLKENALHGQPLTVSELLKLMMKKEEEDGKPGYEKKVKILKELLNFCLAE